MYTLREHMRPPHELDQAETVTEGDDIGRLHLPIPRNTALALRSQSAVVRHGQPRRDTAATLAYLGAALSPSPQHWIV